jgi:hypothetical protein
MAAVVASHHIGLWQERREPSIHIPNMHLANMMPPYETSRAVTNAPVSRSYHPTSSHMDINMPLFSTHGLTTSVPYQSGAFAFDPISANPYNMQQASYYSSNLSHSVSYGASPDVQSLSTVRNARNAFNSLVKSESTSPIQSNPMYNEAAYAAECKRSSSEPTEGSGTNFATDVDTLMRAIQAKQTTSVQPMEPKVRRCCSAPESQD